MFTSFQITNFDFFQKFFPNFEITPAVKETVKKIVFPGFESLNGFRIKKETFFKKLKEHNVLIPEQSLPGIDFLLSDKEAETTSFLFG
jgi:hypothetical protein